MSQGKAVWSLDVEGVSNLAASESRGELALTHSDGSLQLWDVEKWVLRATFSTRSCGSALMYGSIKPSKKQSDLLPDSFLLVRKLFYFFIQCANGAKSTN